MKNRKNLSLLLMAVVVILELLPYGTVLNFARPPEEGGVWRKTFSYFDMTPFGYANFGPFLTAIISLLIMLMLIILLFTKGQKLWGAVKLLSAAGVITSLMPLMLGMEYYTVIGLAISLLFVAEFIVTCIKTKGD